MKKNVLIIENFCRTVSWIKAIKLIHNVDIYVVNMVPQLKSLILQDGVAENKILELHHFNKNDNNADTLNKLAKYEKQFKIKINEIINMDRILKKVNYSIALNYLAYIIREIDRFLSSHHIEFIFMEATWAHEILICEYARIKGIKVYVPHTARLPYERFLFFEGYKQKHYYKRNHSQIKTHELADKVFNDVVNRNKKPFYFAKNNKKNEFSITWVKGLINQINIKIKKQNNPFLIPSITELIRGKIIKLLRLKIIQKQKYFLKLSEIKAKFILVCLHVQPEASIDVLSNKYSNQLENIRKISMSTPVEYKIVVKEHSNALGDRPLQFYRNLQRIPGVVLLDPYADSHDAIGKSDLVITVTGTVAYEAALLGKKAVTMVPMFFSGLLFKEFFNPNEDSVEEMIKEDMPNNNAIYKSIEEILKNSFPGDTTDTRSNPDVLLTDNLVSLSTAFKEVIFDS